MQMVLGTIIYLVYDKKNPSKIRYYELMYAPP